MPLPMFITATFATSIVGGLVGSILGLGGATIIIPVLTLVFGMDIRYAAGAGVVAVIATSSGAAVAYIRDHLTNTRIGMMLEVGTVVGSLTGAYLAGIINPNYLYVLFGLLLLYSAINMFQARKTELPEGVVADRLSQRLRLEGSYFDKALGRKVEYRATRSLGGLAVMYAAGAIGGLLGIGAGAFKVLGMDQVMRLPIKVSSATSNFMMGVTAAASAAVYFARGQITPMVAAPVALGVLAGALLGSKVMVRLKSKTIRMAFVPVLLYIAGQMIWKGWHI